MTDNKVFYQHPDLMRALCVHETVMNVMVNVLEKHQTSIHLLFGEEDDQPANRGSTLPRAISTSSASSKVPVRKSDVECMRMCVGDLCGYLSE